MGIHSLPRSVVFLQAGLVLAPDLPPQYQRICRPGPEEPHHQGTDPDLVVPAKHAKEAHRVDDVELPVQAVIERRTILGKNVAGDELGAEAAPVAEQVVSQVDELGPKVRSREDGGGCAVEGQLAQGVPEAAAGVEQLLAGP